MARLIYEGFWQSSCCSQQYLGFCAHIKHDILIFWAVLITDPLFNIFGFLLLVTQRLHIACMHFLVKQSKYHGSILTMY